MSETKKMKGVRPVLWVCKGFFVVLRRACGMVRGSKTEICDLEYERRWYMCQRIGFKGFLKACEVTNI